MGSEGAGPSWGGTRAAPPSVTSAGRCGHRSSSLESQLFVASPQFLVSLFGVGLSDPGLEPAVPEFGSR